jgi:hypothetical protein
MAHKHGTLGQFPKEMAVVCIEIGKNSFVVAKFEVRTPDFNRGHFLISQPRCVTGIFLSTW